MSSRSAPDALIAELQDALAKLTPDASQADVMKALRQIKKRSALLIAVADLSGQLEPGTGDCGPHRLGRCQPRAPPSPGCCATSRGLAKLSWRMPPIRCRGCGYVALAMGKQGAANSTTPATSISSSSTTPDTRLLPEGSDPATFFVRFTRRLVQLMQDVTEDGYVFRTDLRLRPDPRATQVAISIEAAALYYENLGQNWERAAMIKARAAAGDIALGEEFLDRLKPYIWRKYLDFAAIADVQSLKRQIHAVKGHGEIEVQGHNLKLGRGGIREIEFFVQTQQLIAGGRNPKLRGRSTLAMLDALADAQWITPLAAAELKSAYRFLRTIEHRVQMVNDEQTHALPHR